MPRPKMSPKKKNNQKSNNDESQNGTRKTCAVFVSCFIMEYCLRTITHNSRRNEHPIFRINEMALRQYPLEFFAEHENFSSCQLLIDNPIISQLSPFVKC